MADKFLDKLFNSCYDPRDLPNDGLVEKGDFVFRREGIGYVFFLRPKNLAKKPKSLFDGTPLFVKLSCSLKMFGRQTIGDYLGFLAKRFELSIKKLKAKKKEEIWQFC